MCSPARRSGSKIPIGEFWAEKRDKAKKSKVPALVLDQSGKFEDTADKENLGYEGAGGGNVKQKHIKNYEILTQDVNSPVINKAEYESQFSGLLETIMSPEYKKAELDFEKIAQENISSENLLDDTTEEFKVGGVRSLEIVNDDGQDVVVVEEHEHQDNDNEVSVSTQDQNQNYSSIEEANKKRLLQSTPKDSKTKCQERNTNDLSKTRDSFHGFETSTEVILDRSSDISSGVNSTCGNIQFNAHSIGSSLNGENLTSWIGTTNTTNEILSKIKVGKSEEVPKEIFKVPKIEDDDVNATPVQNAAESSDYVSGDSCDLVSPPSATPIPVESQAELVMGSD